MIRKQYENLDLGTEIHSHDVRNAARDDLSLAEGDVDLWFVDLDSRFAFIDLHLEKLSPDEKERAKRYVFASDRDRFIVGRTSLRKILGGYLGIQPEEVAISTRKFGKPYLTKHENDLRFNVSHSNGVCVIAVSVGREVGVDIEFVDDDLDVLRIAPGVLSTSEVERMRLLPANRRGATFFAAWTRKEAFLKAIGDGLSSSDELQLAVSSMSDDDDSLIWFDNDVAKKWSVTSFQFDTDYKVALVVEGTFGTVKLRHSVNSKTGCIRKQGLAQGLRTKSPHAAEPPLSPTL